MSLGGVSEWVIKERTSWSSRNKKYHDHDIYTKQYDWRYNLIVHKGGWTFWVDHWSCSFFFLTNITSFPLPRKFCNVWYCLYWPAKPPVAADTPKKPFLARLMFSRRVQSSKSSGLGVIPICTHTWMGEQTLHSSKWNNCRQYATYTTMVKSSGEMKYLLMNRKSIMKGE